MLTSTNSHQGVERPKASIASTCLLPSLTDRQGIPLHPIYILRTYYELGTTCNWHKVSDLVLLNIPPKSKIGEIHFSGKFRTKSILQNSNSWTKIEWNCPQKWNPIAARIKYNLAEQQGSIDWIYTHEPKIAQPAGIGVLGCPRTRTCWFCSGRRTSTPVPQPTASPMEESEHIGREDEGEAGAHRVRGRRRQLERRVEDFYIFLGFEALFRPFIYHQRATEVVQKLGWAETFGRQTNLPG